MNILFFILGFALLILITIFIFINKKKVEKTEKKKIFNFMIIFTILSVICELIGNIVYLDKSVTMPSLLSKIFMISVLTTVFLYTCYNLLITHNIDSFKQSKKAFILRRVYFFIYLIVMFFIIVTESLFTNNELINYSYGLSSDILFLSIIFYFITWLVSLFFNYEKIENENSLLFIYLLIGIYSLIIRIFYPQILFISLVESYLIIYTYLKDFNIKKEINNNNDDYFKDLSYKIRTPLNAIVSFSEFVTKANTLEEAKENATDIIDTSNYLLSTVNNYLDMIKAEDGNLEINETDYNSYIMFESIIDAAKDALEKDNVKLKTHISYDIPEMLYGDYVNIKKIVNTLISYSIRNTNKGYIDLSVKCVKSHGLCRLIFSIKDTGIGIKKEELDKLFNDNSIPSLKIVKQLVEMMGGKIVVESELGKGSKYTVAIDQKTSNKIIEKDSVEVVETLNLKGKDILIVDDNKLILKMIKRMLENFNANVITVTSGMECLKAVEKEKYDLILLDENMPRMNGFDTLIKLKQIKDFNIPVIILVADKDNIKNHLDEGFTDYLLKPINHNKLHDILSKYINVNETDDEIIDIIDDDNPNKNNIEFLINNGIDANKGIELLGDIVMYNDMLSEFNEEINDRIEKLKEYKDSDINNYAIVVHSLKSDSQYLGFKDLAEEALNHELEAKKNNQDYINNNFDKLMDLLNNVLNIIRQYL